MSEKSDAEAPTRKKAKKSDDPPGYTDGPPIKFILKKESKLTSQVSKRGHPRLVDLSSFTEGTNKQNFFMADIVATILWNYKLDVFKAFFDVDIYAKFHFFRKEIDASKQDVAIVRESQEVGLMLKCGYLQRGKEDEQSKNPCWAIHYEYIISEKGLWTPHAQKKNDLVHSVDKAVIQQEVTELGTELFLRKLWAEGKRC